MMALTPRMTSVIAIVFDKIISFVIGSSNILNLILLRMILYMNMKAGLVPISAVTIDTGPMFTATKANQTLKVA